MRNSITFVAFACIAMSGLANAQKVYKCVDPNGTTVFSSTECGKDAKEIVVDTSRTIGGSNRPDAALQAISDSVADSDCRRGANALYDYASQARIDDINAHHWVGSSAAQRQTIRRMDEQELLSLQTRVDDSRKRVTDALAECDARKR
jgi:hypothetical protein